MPRTHMAEPELDKAARLPPLWNVILWNDDDHSFDYVIEMLGKLFGHSSPTGLRMAMEVHSAGRCVVSALPRERAEFKRDQIHAYGADRRIPRCKGSMSATVEPTPE